MNKRAVMMLLAATVVTGCAPRPPVIDEPLPQLQIVETLETDADRLLNYYAYMTELQGDTLEREYRFVEKAYTDDPNEYNQMQLIMLLASPRVFTNSASRSQMKRWNSCAAWLLLARSTHWSPALAPRRCSDSTPTGSTSGARTCARATRESTTRRPTPKPTRHSTPVTVRL